MTEFRGLSHLLVSFCQLPLYLCWVVCQSNSSNFPKWSQLASLVVACMFLKCFASYYLLSSVSESTDPCFLQSFSVDSIRYMSERSALPTIVLIPAGEGELIWRVFNLYFEMMAPVLGCNFKIFKLGACKHVHKTNAMQCWPIISKLCSVLIRYVIPSHDVMSYICYKMLLLCNVT